MLDEGYIKFNAHWETGSPLPPQAWEELAFWRQRLYQNDWIGVYPDGIGYGNISYREQTDQVCPFIITGSKTGAHSVLTAQHFSRVTGWSAQTNSVDCTGPIVASSESMSHAAIYEVVPTARVVMHIHSRVLWEKHLWELPTTPADVPYGSPEMVWAVQDLLREHKDSTTGVIVMAGHEEGFFAYGENYQVAFSALMDLL